MACDIEEMRKDAEAGSGPDQTMLGSMYLFGVGVEINYEEAFKWLSLAAAQGTSRGCANLGYMYAEGLGIPKNIQKALPLLDKGLRTDEYVSALTFARICARGEEGVPVDEAEAVDWYKEFLGIYQEVIDQSVETDETRAIDEALAYTASHDRPSMD